MKKIILLGFAFSLLSTSAFAAGATFSATGTTATTTSAGGMGVLANYKASKQVNVFVLSVAQTYAAIADHLNGTRIFGTASGDSLLYFNQGSKTPGTQAAISTNLSKSDSTAFVGATGWSSL